jgi:hypothetical protein
MTGGVALIVPSANRMAPMVYTPEGEEIAARLWQETMDEFSFAGLKEILDTVRG